MLTLAADADIVKWMVIGLVAVVAVGGTILARIVSTMARERSRREIAAYIAEGSMTPEQGERLMKAAEPEKSDWS